MAVEKQPEAPPVAEKKEKVPKEKKEKVPKEKNPKSDKVSDPAHPPYFQMIKEALLALNERGGSSHHAISKYMEEKHKDVLPANYKKMLGVQLKNCVANEKLIKIRASFKLSDSSKKEKKVVLKTVSVKPVADVGEKTKKKKKQTSSTKPKSTTVVAKSKSETAPKKKKAVVPAKKVAATPTKKTLPAKKVAHVKKTKRTTPVKAKQPKSIKSLAAKRAKKVVA